MRRSNVSATVLSDSARVAIYFLEQLGAKIEACGYQKDFPFIRIGVALANACEMELPDRLRPFKHLLHALGGRQTPLRIQVYLPCFRRCIARTHVNYIIAAGGAGSFGSPAFASGMRISISAINAITTMPTSVRRVFAKTSVELAVLVVEPAGDQAGQRFARDQPGSHQHADVFDARLLRFVASAALAYARR